MGNTDNNTIASLANNKESIHIHLNIFQEIIKRMATNSASMKTWCVAVISALLAMLVNMEKLCYAHILIVPIILFMILDLYYLALEKRFRDSYNDFTKKLHSGLLKQNDLFIIKPYGSVVKSLWKSLLSFSVWGFYGGIIVLIFIIVKNLYC